MDDETVVHHISKLVEEERELRAHAASTGGLDTPGRERIQQLEVQLDQCWDLLRQRRARREFGQDPGDAQVRAVSEVEGYRQ